MKKIVVTLCMALIALIIYGQSPEALSYQAVLRDNTGSLISSENVQVRITIIDNTTSGPTLYREIHSKTTNQYGIVSLTIGTGSLDEGSFSSINWALNKKYLKIEVDAGSGYTDMGTVQLVSVPYSFYSDIADYANEANTANVLGSNAVYSPSTDTLFVVKDNSGNVVFAVFPDGAQVIVNETAKGKVGGFAVSGRNPAKAVDTEILRITADSTRIYVNDTVSNKGKLGGFAVSGRNPAKNMSTEILFVTADSTRVYVNEDAGAKGKIGGFAVSGRNPAKGTLTSYMQVTPDSTRIFVKDTVAGFEISNLEDGTVSSLLNLNKQNYFIGHQTGENNTEGIYNSMIGYQAGYNNSSGSGNIFYGYKAGYSNVTGGDNVFIGKESGYSNQYTFQSTYVGYRSGYEVTGSGNTFLGSRTGESASGGSNTFIGTSAGRLATGGSNLFIGHWAGYGFPDINEGTGNVYIGNSAGGKTTTGDYNVMIGHGSGYLNYEGAQNTFIGYNTGNNIHEGSGNVFIGYEAGYSADGINDRLIIDNSDNAAPLIWGEFDYRRVGINDNAPTAALHIKQVGLSEEGLAIENDNDTDVWSWEIGGNDLNLYFNGTQVGWWDDANGAYSGVSDKKLKKDVKIIDEQILNKVLKLQLVDYRLMHSSKSSKKTLGFIAQDVQEVLPEIVNEREDGYLGLNYDNFGIIAIKAIQEQQNIIEELRNKNTELEERIKKLEELITK